MAGAPVSGLVAAAAVTLRCLTSVLTNLLASVRPGSLWDGSTETVRRFVCEFLSTLRSLVRCCSQWCALTLCASVSMAARICNPSDTEWRLYMRSSSSQILSCISNIHTLFLFSVLSISYLQQMLRWSCSGLCPWKVKRRAAVCDRWVFLSTAPIQSDPKSLINPNMRLYCHTKCSCMQLMAFIDLLLRLYI